MNERNVPHLINLSNALSRTFLLSTEMLTPVVFMKNTIRGQYIIEGIAGGAMFVAGAVGLIVVDRGGTLKEDNRIRLFLVVTGCAILAIAYNAILIFFRKKIPGYLSG